MDSSGYTADGQDPKVVRRVLGRLRPFLADDERIYYVVVQRKPKLNFLPDSIVVTDQHLFLCEYIQMGFGMRVESLPWSRMRSILPDRRQNGVTLKIVSETEIDYIVDHIPGKQAERLLEYAREQAKSRRGSHSTSPSEPKPIAESEPIVEAKPIAEAEPSVEAKSVAESESIVEAKPSAEPEPQSDSTVDKFRSLYLRQRITRSEYESKSQQQQQQQQFEN